MNNKQGFNNHLLFILFIPVVITAKILRWTIMKASTVDAGVGYYFIRDICERTSEFIFLGASIDVEVKSPASHNAIYLFRLFNWFDCKTYAEFEFVISLVFNFLLLAILIDFSARNRAINKIQLFFLLFSIGVMNVYTFTLSKEPIQMLYFLLMYLVLRRKISSSRKWMLIYGIIFLIVITTRTYYLLMLAFVLVAKYLFVKVDRHFPNKFLHSFFCFILLIGGVYLSFLYICSFIKPDEFNELIRVRTREAEAITDIRNILPTTNLPLFVTDYLIIILRMLFPVELLRFGLKYGVFVAYQSMISWVMLKALREYKENTLTKNIAVFLYWGFLFCSATFEPDFGSWIRHESVAIPFMLFVLEDSKKHTSPC